MAEASPVKWSDELREVTDQFQYDERLVFTPKDLPDDLQFAVEWIMDASGGKYNKRDKGYVFMRAAPWNCVHATLVANFRYDPCDCVDIQQTPVDVARFIVGKMEVREMMCMEPSAGEGVIVYELIAAGAISVRAIEINQRRAKLCSGLVDCTHQNFLDLDPERYKTRFDRIVMNPPRTRGQDLAHLQHALQFCKSGGRIACIMPEASEKLVGQRGPNAVGRVTDRLVFKPDTFTCLGKPFPTVCVFLTK